MTDTPYRREPGYAGRYRDRRFAIGHGPRTDQRERAAIRRLLAEARRLGAVGPGPWLDMPSGAGRLSAELPAPVVQADRDPAMLQVCPAAGRRVAASATALPFCTGAFAGALCCRFLQHIPTGAERRRILAELRRVCRGPVIVSFFDAASLLALRRRLRRIVGKARSGRSAVLRTTFAADARVAGYRVLCWRSLQRFVAEQTLALLLPLPAAA